MKTKYGNAKDWSTVLSGIGEGSSESLKDQKELREKKRKTLAGLLNNAIKRNKALFRTGQEHSNDMNEFQSQRMQQIARGFVDSLYGSTHHR
jgi:ribonuclease HII